MKEIIAMFLNRVASSSQIAGATSFLYQNNFNVENYYLFSSHVQYWQCWIAVRC